MTPALVKNFILVCLCSLMALALGFSISLQVYTLLVLPVIIALFIATMVIPGYSFLLAFGMTCPFVLPLPFVWGMPMLLLIVGLCALKYILRRAVGKERLVINYSLPVAIFFGWVVVRYCMNPVKPGIALGMSEGVTGFRAYVNYALCAAVFLAVGLFKREADVAKMLRWMCALSAGFICIFMPLMFTKSLAVGTILSNLGVWVTVFENGWLRFVILPDFGLILIMAALLPNLFRFRKVWRVAAMLLGLAAVILGGNRSSLVMLFAVGLIFAFVRYRTRGLLVSLSVVAGCLLALYYIGETEPDIDPALYRLTALVSPHAAQITEADQTVEWRKVRWERAMEDIREHPWVGMSYGGLENAFIFANASDFQRATVDIDVASGTIHNGYLANARSLGIPSLVLFALLFLSHIVRQAKQTLVYRNVDALRSELHAFIWMNLVCIGLHIYIGIDLNTPQLWLYIGLCVLLQRIKSTVATPNGSALRSPDPTVNPSRFAFA